MEVFVAKRRGGKSTWALKKCESLCEKGYYACIVCVSVVAARHLSKLAEELGLYLSEPIPACELARRLRERCVDDPKQVLILDELTHLPKKTVALAFSEFLVWGATITLEEEKCRCNHHPGGGRSTVSRRIR